MVLFQGNGRILKLLSRKRYGIVISFVGGIEILVHILQNEIGMNVGRGECLDKQEHDRTRHEDEQVDFRLALFGQLIWWHLEDGIWRTVGRCLARPESGHHLRGKG